MSLANPAALSKVMTEGATHADVSIDLPRKRQTGRAKCAQGVAVNRPADRWIRAFAAIAEQPELEHTSDDISTRLSRICRAAMLELGGLGVGVSVLTDDGTRGILAASDEFTYLLEELQFTLGEGPCVDAYLTRRPILVADLSGDDARTRWPFYVQAVTAHRVRAVFALPLQVGAARIGALALFGRQPGPLVQDILDQALTFAEITLATVLDSQGALPQHLPSPALYESSGHRAELAQAQGMVMVQLGVTIGEALIRLRAHAYAQGRPLHQVAQDVVDRKLRFDQVRP
jgi:transcriptional regulator with GAF, ATPase, and Fis domain